jgi:hypothetical protein
MSRVPVDHVQAVLETSRQVAACDHAADQAEPRIVFERADQPIETFAKALVAEVGEPRRARSGRDQRVDVEYHGPKSDGGERAAGEVDRSGDEGKLRGLHGPGSWRSRSIVSTACRGVLRRRA